MKKTITLLSAFFSLGIILVGFSLLQASLLEQKSSEQSSQNKSYVESNTFHYSANESFQIDSTKDKEGENFAWVAGVDWKGTMGITFCNIRSVHSLDSDILQRQYLASNDIKRQMKRLDDEKESTLILYDVKLDASKLSSKSKSKQHHAEDFTPKDDSFVSSEPLYLKGCNFGTKSYSGTNGYQYKIDENDKKTITIGYLANREIEKTGFTVSLGTTGWEKYLVDIASSDIEVIE